MRLALFIKFAIILHLFSGVQAHASPVGSIPCFEHFHGFLKSIVKPATPSFDSKLFQSTLERLKAMHEGLQGIRFEDFKSPEEKLALFEVLTKNGTQESPLDLARLLESADEETFRRISTIIENVKSNPKAGVSVRLSRNAIQDLYLLSHPAPKKSFLRNLLPPSQVDAEDLIRRRCELDLASLNAEEALDHLGWSDRRKVEQLRLWLHTHSNLRNTLLSSAVDSVPLGGVKLLEQATQMAIGNPGLSNFFVRFPKLKLYWPKDALLKRLQITGLAGLESELSRSDRMRAAGELYYDYLKSKVGPAMSLYLMHYIYENWSDEKNIVGLVRLLASSVSLNAKNLQDVQDRDLGTGKVQIEQAESSLAAELVADPHPSSERLWTIAKNNLRQTDDQIFTEYQKKSSVNTVLRRTRSEPAAFEVSRVVSQFLEHTDASPEVKKGFELWAKERISVEAELAHELSKRSLILPDQLWLLSEKLIKSRNTSLVAASPKNISSIARETLDRFQESANIKDMKKWLKKKEILSELIPQK